MIQKPEGHRNTPLKVFSALKVESKNPLCNISSSVTLSYKCINFRTSIEQYRCISSLFISWSYPRWHLVSRIGALGRPAQKLNARQWICAKSYIWNRRPSASNCVWKLDRNAMPGRRFSGDQKTWKCHSISFCDYAYLQTINTESRTGEIFPGVEASTEHIMDSNRRFRK